MTRYKTFDSTGVAPGGKLYAGDLNGIQDHYADLSDFTQTIDLATLRVGDSSLQIVKFGSGEFRLTGRLRADGAFLPGSYTTTQRNAITSPPSGLMLWNSTTTQLEVNTGTSGSPVWTPGGIGADQIVAGLIAAGAIGTSELAALAVTGAKIAAATITNDKLAAADGLVLHRSTNLSLPSNTWTDIGWDTEVTAEGTTFWNSAEAFDLSDAGWHHIVADVEISPPGGGGVLGIRIIDVTGSNAVIAKQGPFNSAALDAGFSADFYGYRSAANEYKVQAFASGGGAVIVNGLTPTVTARIER